MLLVEEFQDDRALRDVERVGAALGLAEEGAEGHLEGVRERQQRTVELRLASPRSMRVSWRRPMPATTASARVESPRLTAAQARRSGLELTLRAAHEP